MLTDMRISSSVVGEVVKKDMPHLLIHRKDEAVYSFDKLQPDGDELA